MCGAFVCTRLEPTCRNPSSVSPVEVPEFGCVMDEVSLRCLSTTAFAFYIFSAMPVACALVVLLPFASVLLLLFRSWFWKIMAANPSWTPLLGEVLISV